MVERQTMNVISNVFTPLDRMRYALNRIKPTEASWSARELFFLVKIFFPAESRSNVCRAAATLCTSGEFSISRRRYTRKALKPVQTEAVNL